MPTKPWVLVDRASVPGQEQTMDLTQRGDEFALRVGGIELMNSRMHGSEDALAELACERLAHRRDARILIGGLGMGFTLAAALGQVGPGARLVVAELVPAVVRWNRDVLGGVAGHPLRDPRTTVHEGDVAELIRSERGTWDAILLDVDNGPTALTKSTNQALYGPAGLTAAFQALRAGGVFGVWSAASDARFTQRLERAGFDVREARVPARGAQGGRRHVVWLGVRPVHPPRRSGSS